MADFGITDEGFNRKTYPDIRDDMLEDAREIFGPDWNLGPFSVVGLVIRSTAFGLDRAWAVLGTLYSLPFVRISHDRALDLAVDYLGLDRQPAQVAEGMVTFVGDPGITIPAGTQVGRADDPEFPVFETDREVTIQPRGRVEAFVTAQEPGTEGNIGAGSITDLMSPVSGVDSVNNSQFTSDLTIGDEANATAGRTVAVSENNVYQTVLVEDIDHDIFLTGFTFRVENTSGSTENYRIRFRLLDDQSGAVIQEIGDQVYSLTSAVHDLVFDGFEADIRSADTVRIEFFLEPDSDGPLDFILDTSDNYTNGAFFIAGTEQTGEDLVLDVTSETLGEFRRGQDPETDQELRNRYFQSLARGGAGTLDAIESGLRSTEGVIGVSLRENVTDSTVNGLPPHSFEATVQGASNEEVARTIIDEKPAGIEDFGTTSVTVEDPQGNLREISFVRPTEVFIEYSVSVDTNDDFAASGDDEIKDALVDLVGGTNLDGETVSGLDIGDDVVHSKSVGAVVNIDGVVDATVQLTQEGGSLGTSNVVIDSDEIARTSPGRITVTVN